VTEAMRVIRMVKLFGWEKRLESQISSKRDAELSFVKKSKLYSLLNAHSNLLIPMCTMMITYGFYTAVFKKELNASVVFPSMAVFEILRVRIRTVVMKIPSLVQGKVALDRLDDFLRNTRLVDRFDAQQYLPVPFDPSVIGFRNVEFRWLGSSDEEFKLKFNGDVLFRKDCVNLIVGPTGSGKTSLLLALLGSLFVTFTISTY
jgi:ABC-type multidrug transport system fused ATPase/permease subunit